MERVVHPEKCTVIVTLSTVNRLRVKEPAFIGFMRLLITNRALLHLLEL